MYGFHLIMAAYGWTLDYVLDGLTLPQTFRLIEMIGEMPPTNILGAMLLKGATENDGGLEKMKGTAGVDVLTVQSESFLKQLGVGLGH